MHNLNPANLNYYPLMISLDKCSGNFSTGNDLPTKICVPSKARDANLKSI